VTIHAADLRPYLTDPAWFRREPFGIHGITHVTRVLIWSAVLADQFGCAPAIRIPELYWAAATHDVERIDDGTDRGHGERAAAWVTSRLVAERPLARKSDLGFVAELDRWHEVTDREIGCWSLELLLFKDADGLDRVRIYDLNPAFLRTQLAPQLAIQAKQLMEMTTALREPAAVLDAAVELGIVEL
jgi:hypothetical protein